MTVMASVVQASMMVLLRSYRSRSRLRPLTRLIVRSTTQRTLPRPLPCATPFLRLADQRLDAQAAQHISRRLAVVTGVDSLS